MAKRKAGKAVAKRKASGNRKWKAEVSFDGVTSILISPMQRFGPRGFSKYEANLMRRIARLLNADDKRPAAKPRRKGVKNA